MTADPIVSWMRGEWRREALISVGFGALAVAVLALFIVGLVTIA